MTTQVSMETVPAGQPPVCVHRWVLEPADQATGGLVGGACVHCGETRTFSAHAEDYSRFSVMSAVVSHARQPRFALSDDEPEVD